MNKSFLEDTTLSQYRELTNKSLISELDTTPILCVNEFSLSLMNRDISDGKMITN